jgi:hypothetical protein
MGVGGASDLKIASENPITYFSLWACASGAFLGGIALRGAFGAMPRNHFLVVFSILVFFVIFSGFLN